MTIKQELVKKIDDLKFFVEKNPYDKGEIDKSGIKQQLALINHLVSQVDN